MHNVTFPYVKIIFSILQNIDVYEEYGNLRGDRLLNIEQLFGEVLANVMGDLKMKGSGIFYDIDKFEGNLKVFLIWSAHLAYKPTQSMES